MAILPLLGQLLGFLFKLFGVSVEAREAFLKAVENIPGPQAADRAQNDAIKEAEEKWRRDNSVNSKSSSSK